MACFKL